MNDQERKVLANIEKHGFHSVLVFDPDQKLLNFTYSVGFPTSLGVPDCIVVGLDTKLMHNMLWEVFHQVKAGKALKHLETWSAIINGDYVCNSIDAVSVEDGDGYFMNTSIWYWHEVLKRREPFRAFQIVWPNAQNLMPWEKGVDPEFHNVQPILGPTPL